MLKIIPLILLIAIGHQCMATEANTYFAEKEKNAKRVFLEYVALIDEINTDLVYIYEGLPHDTWEHNLYKNEIQKDNLIKIGGYPFYDLAHELKGKNAQAILSILMNPEEFKPYVGPKLCGGFHPDYDIKFLKSSGYHHFQVCFSCYEIKIVSHNNERIIDMLPETVYKLKTHLVKFHKYRPESEYFKTKLKN